MLFRTISSMIGPSLHRHAAGIARLADNPRFPTDHSITRSLDHSMDIVTRPDAALLYRLTGDRNPIHAEPEFAHSAALSVGALPRPDQFMLTWSIAVDESIHVQFQGIACAQGRGRHDCPLRRD
jgi:acyl dehydratase